MATSVGIKMNLEGAAQFKADLQQINQKSKELASEMKAVATGTNNAADKQRVLASQIDNAKNKIDLLTKKYDSQKAALDASNNELEEAKRLYGEDSQQVQKLTTQVTKQETALSKTKTEINKATAELNKLESEEEDATSATKKLASAEKSAGDASSQMKQGFTTLKGALANLAADGIRKVVDGLKEIMTAGPAFADEIMTMASQTHLATDTLQELSYMSDLVDVDVSTVAGSMKKLTKSMSSAKGGTGAAADTFKSLGVSVTDSNGALRSSEEVFFDTIDALGKIENETERDAAAMSIFGKSATDLNPMIEAGADQLRGFAQEAHEMGYVLDSSSLRALGRVQDEFDRFKQQMTSVKNQIASGLAPAMERAMKKIQSIVKGINWQKVGEQLGKAFERVIDVFEWIIDHGNEIKSALTGIVTAMAAAKVMQFVSAVSKMAKGLQTATVAQEGMNAAANANPYILLASAIIGVTAAVVSYGKKLIEANYEASLHVQRAHELTAATSETNAAVEESVARYNEMQEARDASMNASLAEISNAEMLAKQLEGLADANGVVADGDKARAQFILNELNNALGTEYSMTGNVIDQYANLKNSIAEVIQMKQAEAVLAAEQEAYNEAVVNRADAEALLVQKAQEKLDIETQMAENDLRIAELEQIIASTGMYSDAQRAEMANLTSAQTELQGTLDETNAKYNEAAAVVDRYAYDAQQYTNNMTAALAGDYSQISHMSYDTAKAQGLASSQASQAVSKNATQASSNWVNSFAGLLSTATGKTVEFQDVGKGMIQAMINGQKAGEPMTLAQLAALRNKMKADMSKSATDAKSSGKQIPYGIASGINSNSGVAYSAVSQLANNIIAQFNKDMVIKSPSRVFAESGKFMVAGIAKGINDNAGLAMNAVSGLSSSLTSAMDLSASVGTASLGNSTINDSRKNSVTMNIYGADGQSVNDLADVVIDKLQRTIIGSEAVYA